MADEKIIIGVDVGGTKVASGRVSFRKKSRGWAYSIDKEARTESRRNGTNREIRESIQKAIDAVWQDNVEAIGIGVPGFVDEKGNVFSLTNLPNWKKENLAEKLTKKYGVPVFAGNDADCFTLAESMFGKARKARKDGTIIGITLGTGVGGGVVINGKIHKTGGRKGGTEIGHMVIDPSGPKCRCGLKGCFESWCSGKGIEKIYKKITGKSIRAEEITPGSMEERRAVKIASEKLSLALASLINGLNPDYIAVGGGASNIPQYVEPAIKKAVRISFPENARCTTIYISKNPSGVAGAACLALVSDF